MEKEQKQYQLDIFMATHDNDTGRQLNRNRLISGTILAINDEEANEILESEMKSIIHKHPPEEDGFQTFKEWKYGRTNNTLKIIKQPAKNIYLYEGFIDIRNEN